MNGFLFDENLPANILFRPSFPINHVSILGPSPSDTNIWEYAKEKDLVIVTKDADFSDRMMIDSSPPKVVHLRIRNLRKKAYHTFLARMWPNIEALLDDHKLINVYLDRLEAIK